MEFGEGFGAFAGLYDAAEVSENERRRMAAPGYQGTTSC